MFSSRKNNVASWLLLVFIGISITFSTLHSHHHLEWDHTDSHVDTGHCLVDNTNICPICGYLFNANTVERSSQQTPVKITGYVAIFSDSQQRDPFTGQPNGRSPPLLG
ncbi:MAG: hypothetical protein JXR26_09380 [Balneolaceae bacterium]|nr:hypothetical protein [Balneolaceae bacterium]